MGTPGRSLGLGGSESSDRYRGGSANPTSEPARLACSSGRAEPARSRIGAATRSRADRTTRRNITTTPRPAYSNRWMTCRSTRQAAERRGRPTGCASHDEPLHERPDQGEARPRVPDQERPDQDRPLQEFPDQDRPLHELPTRTGRSRRCPTRTGRSTSSPTRSSRTTTSRSRSHPTTTCPGLPRWPSPEDRRESP